VHSSRFLSIFVKEEVVGFRNLKEEIPPAFLLKAIAIRGPETALVSTIGALLQ
jgi:hypothetical protein